MDEQLQLFQRPHRPQLLPGFDAQPAHRPVGGAVQEPDDRAEDEAVDAQGKGDDQHRRHGKGDGHALGHQLPRHHLGHRGQHQGQGDGDARPGRLGQRAQQWLQHLGDGRLGDEAEHQRGDGDAQLAAREVERQPLEGGEGARRPAVPGPGQGLHAIAVDGHQGELGHHEESIGQDQQGDGQKADGSIDGCHLR